MTALVRHLRAHWFRGRRQLDGSGTDERLFATMIALASAGIGIVAVDGHRDLDPAPLR